MATTRTCLRTNILNLRFAFSKPLQMVLSKWDDAQAAKCDGDLLALRVYTSRLMS